MVGGVRGELVGNNPGEAHPTATNDATAFNRGNLRIVLGANFCDVGDEVFLVLGGNDPSEFGGIDVLLTSKSNDIRHLGERQAGATMRNDVGGRERFRAGRSIGTDGHRTFDAGDNLLLLDAVVAIGHGIDDVGAGARNLVEKGLIPFVESRSHRDHHLLGNNPTLGGIVLTDVGLRHTAIGGVRPINGGADEDGLRLCIEVERGNSTVEDRTGLLNGSLKRGAEFLKEKIRDRSHLKSLH